MNKHANSSFVASISRYLMRSSCAIQKQYVYGNRSCRCFEDLVEVSLASCIDVITKGACE